MDLIDFCKYFSFLTPPNSYRRGRLRNRDNRMLGWNPQVCKACTCPAWRLRKQPRFSNTDISDLMDRELTCLKQGPGVTPYCVQQMAVGRTWWYSSLLPKGKGSLPVIRDWHQVGSLVTTETSSGACSSLPLWQEWWLARARGKHIERSVVWVR